MSILSSPVPAPDLHSLPTRRSSDLPVLVARMPAACSPAVSMNLPLLRTDTVPPAPPSPPEPPRLKVPLNWSEPATAILKPPSPPPPPSLEARSEERRVGKAGMARWAPTREQKQEQPPTPHQP